MTWRVGRKVGRTLYIHHGDDPDGQLVGLMDTPELAAQVVEAMNGWNQSAAHVVEAMNRMLNEETPP